MKVLSLFSGVGGFDLGLEAAGMTTVGLCEWDKKAASVLRRHWPDVPIYGDVSDLTGTQLLADGVRPDLVAFGSPCQDLSVAGKRAGLSGERSGLFHEATRIIRELRALTDGALPRWVIWENVTGALNSNEGADFGAVLDAMGDLGAVFSEWAVLDAQNFGVAQRRRRVFLVACLDPGAARGCPDPLLPVRKGGPRDLVPLREAWKNATGGAPHGARGGHYAARALGFGGYTLDDRTGTLTTRGNHADIDYALIDGTRVGDIRLYEEPVQTLKARMGKGVNTEGARDGHLIISRWTGADIAETLTTSSNEQRMPDKGRLQAVVTPYAVRRLLPIECERLMGWPDDWTRWDADGKEQADSHRYKQCGNGVASPVAEWVGRHIFAQDALGRSVR